MKSISESKDARLGRITLVRTAVTLVIFSAGGMAYLSRTRTRPEHLTRPGGKLAQPFQTDGIQHVESRRLLVVSGSYDDDVDYDEYDDNCTERGISSFPDGIFTNEQRLSGALVVNFLAAIYLCGVIGYVCSTYFVPSLEIMCERLKLETDVAGATFMAAGSSAPELFSSVIGIFISHDDTGLSAIVGSAAFNIFVIIALCCFFSGHVLHINWYPFVRDCAVYVISIILMFAFIYDSDVQWWEGFILSLCYVGYIILMYFNPYLSGRAEELVNKWRARRHKYTNDISSDTARLLGEAAENERGTHYGTVTQSAAAVGNGQVVGQSVLENEHRTRGQTPNSFLSDYEEAFAESDVDKSEVRSRASTIMSNLSCSLPPDHQPLSAPHDSVFTPPESLGFRVLWVVGLPVVVLTFLTVPDCRKNGFWRKLYFVSFVLATVWLAGASYILYWMIVIIGYTLDIPDTVMGITFLAAGTSVPDAVASVLVARDGYGDMALSNIIGSNIFEVFVCLGTLWFIQGLVYSKPLEISSTGLTFTTISLLFTVAFILLAIHLNGWKLDLKMGFTCLVVYLGFITLAIVWELGLIGDFDLPNYCQGPD